MRDLGWFSGAALCRQRIQASTGFVRARGVVRYASGPGLRGGNLEHTDLGGRVSLARQGYEE